ncbi:hypothetical protein [Allochromatium palmeri]|uniref:VCBS repeat-containing protein n=1 Tax=Allochromatium palmeri TaxID=231048 RepID=A0A6N8EEI7_9GAMM|nr:hypothetical protein [Allochromatium palmeri]MTW20947.1 hypothetical protein [Allochromatium palmeri]
MLLTATSSTTLMLSATREQPRPDTARDTRVRTPVPAAPSAIPSSSAGSETLNLSEQVKAQLEQDLDYQILRRAFALDNDGVETQGRASESTHTDQPDTLSGVSADQFDPPAIPAGLSAQSFELQASTQRLEMSMRGGDAAVMLAGANAQRFELNVNAVQVADPLVLDLGGSGITTTGLESGVDFDLNGDGRLERMSTVTGDTWFLALDWNDSGRIDDGRELFGDQNGAAHGFAELARHDDNSDGRIDDQDAVFARLRLVQFETDGSQTSQTLEQADVAAIELAYKNTHQALDAYDQVAQTGRFVRADGRQGEAADILLGYHDLA